MREIIRMQGGSHLHGTAVAGSDQDHNGVFIPSGSSILLQRAQKSSFEKVDGIDLRLFSLHDYLKLLLQGQPAALDMLFTPEKFYLRPPEPEWYAILNNREKFLCKNANAFVGYCQTQIRRYALKAERYAATSAVVAALEHLCITNYQQRGLGYHMDTVQRMVDAHDEVEIVDVLQMDGDRKLAHLQVAGTKIPLTASIKTALNTFRTKLDKYGERVRKVQEMGQTDWKCMMHAVRMSYQAVEFLETGKLTFPRPEASLLLAIRMGKIPYDKVSEMIEAGLVKVEEAQKASSLPEEPDRELADNLIETFYRGATLRP